MRRPNVSRVAFVGAVLLWGCTGGPVDVDAASSGIRAMPAIPDLNYPAVGWFDRGCSATRILPNVVLTAAHCTSDCGALKSGTVRFTVGGQDVSSTSVAYDDIELAPSAFVRGCSGPGTCSSLRVGSDLMLVHLPASSASTLNALGIPAMRVLTSLRDNMSNLYGAHATLDDVSNEPGATFISSPPAVKVVGFGIGDTANGLRRAGDMQFETPPSASGAWHKGCSGVAACSSSNPFPSATCSHVQLNGVTSSWTGSAFSDGQIRLARTSSSPGVWDGPLPTNGDSGGPALIPLSISDPYGAAGGHYIIGALSQAYQSAVSPPPSTPPSTYTGVFGASGDSCSSSQCTQYAATYTTENGAWIEQVSEYWNSGEYSRRANGWSNLDASPNGIIMSNPSACSWGAGRHDVFAVGSDSRIWHYSRQEGGGSGWDSPYPTLAVANVSPGAASAGPNRADVVFIDSANRVRHGYWTGSTWVTPADLGQPPGGLAAGIGVAASAYDVNRMIILAVNTSQTLYQRRFDGFGWGPWESMNGATNATPAVVSWSPNRIDVFVRGLDNQLWTTSYDFDMPGMGWFAWNNSPGWAVVPGSVAIASAPSATSWQPGRIDVFARIQSAPGLIQFTTRDSRGWSGAWATAGAIGFGVTGAEALAAVSWGPGRIDVYGRAANDSSLQRIYFPRL